MVKDPTIGRQNSLQASVVPIAAGHFFSLDKIVVAIPQTKIRHKRQLCDSGLFQGIGGDPRPLCRFWQLAFPRIARVIDPKSILFALEIIRRTSRRIGPARHIQAQ